jgi:hypothetical protein
MTESRDSLDSKHDEQIADFTDRVLKGQIIETDSTADPALRQLEETVLRLNRTLPQTELDDATVKQMWVRLNARARREAQKEQIPFWKRWLLPDQVRPQFGMAFGLVAMVVLLFLVIPAFGTGGGPTIGTALSSSQGIATIVILTGVIVLVFWFARRK